MPPKSLPSSSTRGRLRVFAKIMLQQRDRAGRFKQMCSTVPALPPFLLDRVVDLGGSVPRRDAGKPRAIEPSQRPYGCAAHRWMGIFKQRLDFRSKRRRPGIARPR